MNKRTKAALAVVAFGPAALACGTPDGDSEGPGVGGSGHHAVVFEVSGPATATTITYGINADQSQANGAALPWRAEVASTAVPWAVALVAQSGGDGVITCRITVDGVVKKTNQSSGQFAVVTCSA